MKYVKMDLKREKHADQKVVLEFGCPFIRIGVTWAVGNVLYWRTHEQTVVVPLQLDSISEMTHGNRFKLKKFSFLNGREQY